MKKYRFLLLASMILIMCMVAGCTRESAKSDFEHVTNKPDKRDEEYTLDWIDKETASKYTDDFFGDIVITEIYSNCFFAEPVIPSPYEIKLNGELSEDWCIGDQVSVTYDNTYYDEEGKRVECDFYEVKRGEFVMDPNACYKPVIYLYPENEMEVSVELILDGELTCTYPKYNNGWCVKALPDGTLIDESGMEYNYLYWEGTLDADYDFSKGFCIKGEDTAAFLEEALSKLGLTRREANEFIVYWLPLMQDNPYNIIAFQTDVYTEGAKLNVTPEPDSLIRVFMTYKASDIYVEMDEQELISSDRDGFTVVEWGGTEIK